MKTTIDMAETISHGWWLDDEKLKAFEALVRADERESCAKVCDSLEEQCEKLLVPDEKWPTPSDCAHIIRARGNT
jgi:hypothetical protein